MRHIARTMMVMKARIRRNACPETNANKITEDIIMLSAVGIGGEKRVLYKAEYIIATQVQVKSLLGQK